MKLCIRTILSLILVLCALTACLPAMAATAGEADVRIIFVSPKKLTLEQNDTYQLTVTAKDGGSLPKLQWKSSDAEVVSVDSNGKLTALKEGSAKVVVSSVDGSTDASACRVTVKAKSETSSASDDADVRVIFVSPKTLTLEPDATYQLTVSAKDGGSLPKLQWTSSDPDVVSVDSQGKLTALKKGSAKVVVSSIDGSTDASACRVTVKAVKVTPIDAPIEGNVYDYNYNRVSADTEAAVRAYCERLGSSKTEKMMRKAVSYVGTPYSKVDCSKLVQLVYKSRGINISRVSDDQAEDMYKHRRENGVFNVGDICFMKFPAVKKCNCGSTTCRRFMQIHHSAMYLGKIDGHTYVVDSSSAIGNVIIREFTNNTIAGMPIVFVAGK